MLLLAEKIKILFLAADPSDAVRLRLGQELRDIREQLQLSKLREHFILESREAVRPTDITQAIFDVDPHIIHFSGHGTSSGELCFEDDLGKIQPIQTDVLTKLFGLVNKPIDCVLLNACYSEVQAKSIASCTPYVIGMNQSISDKAAIAFAVGFYRALANKKSFENAYQFGCLEIELKGVQEYSTPVLYEPIKNKDSIKSSVIDIFHNCWIYVLFGKRESRYQRVVGCFRIEHLSSSNTIRASGTAFWVTQDRKLEFRGTWETDEELLRKDKIYFHYHLKSRGFGDPYEKPDNHEGIIRLNKVEQKPLIGNLYYKGYVHDLFDWRDNSLDMFAEQISRSWDKTLDLVNERGVSIFDSFLNRSGLKSLNN